MIDGKEHLTNIWLQSTKTSELPKYSLFRTREQSQSMHCLCKKEKFSRAVTRAFIRQWHQSKIWDEVRQICILPWRYLWFSRLRTPLSIKANEKKEPSKIWDGVSHSGENKEISKMYVVSVGTLFFFFFLWWERAVSLSLPYTGTRSLRWEERTNRLTTRNCYFLLSIMFVGLLWLLVFRTFQTFH